MSTTCTQSEVRFRTLIKDIAFLSKNLPTDVPLAHGRDKIPQVMQKDGEGVWGTFNRRMDALFQEDSQCRDDAGRLRHVRRGPLGMEMVVTYLQSLSPADLAEIPYDLANIKLMRIWVELNYLV